MESAAGFYRRLASAGDVSFCERYTSLMRQATGRRPEDTRGLGSTAGNPPGVIICAKRAKPILFRGAIDYNRMVGYSRDRIGLPRLMVQEFTAV